MRTTRLQIASEPGDRGDPRRPGAGTGSSAPNGAGGSTAPEAVEEVNEDFAAASLPSAGTGGALVVLDGVTPPPDGANGCRHGVAWFTGLLGSTLLAEAGGAPARPLGDCLASAVAETAAAHKDTCDLSHQRTPQATVVAVRWHASAVEYLVLSDSILLVEEVTGVRAVLDPALDRARAAVRSLPRDERAARLEALRNRPGGFFTAAADPAVAARAVTGSVERERVRGLAALTDGVGRWAEVFRLGGWPELYALLATAGPAAAIAAVRAAERADPDGTAAPRGKRHDDATAIHLGGL